MCPIYCYYYSRYERLLYIFVLQKHRPESLAGETADIIGLRTENTMTNGTWKERLIIRLCYTHTIKRTSHKFSKQLHIFGPESNVEYQIDTEITTL